MKGKGSDFGVRNSKKKQSKSSSEEEKWNKLQEYKCTICKEQFYFIKKEAEKDLKEDEFEEEPFTTLPIFKDEGKCPFCKASAKRLLTILSDEQRKEINKKKEEEKKAEKEKLKEELEKLKEEEERLDKMHSQQMAAMCEEIISDTLRHLEDLELSLRKGDITIDRFENLFLDGAFNIMQTDTDLYNRRNKEIALVLSNSFKVGVRNAIFDFNTSVRNSIEDIERKVERKKIEIEKEQDGKARQDVIDKLNSDKEDIEESRDIDLKKDDEKHISDASDDFRKLLKKELR